VRANSSRTYSTLTRDTLRYEQALCIRHKFANLRKVGGLPLIELNHLELQFLLLNDFRLSVPVEELDAYGTMLVEFYAREVMAQQLGETEGVYIEDGGVQTHTPP